MNGKSKEDWICSKGEYKTRIVENSMKKQTKEYILWHNMKKRCCSEEVHNRQPTYKDCTASDLFLDFQSFAKWCNEQIGFKEEGYQLDKDILVKGNKHYNENNCVFVPNWLNSYLINNTANRGDFPVGVHFKTSRRKFRSQITITDVKTKTRVRKDLGYFDNPILAFNAYKQAKEVRAKEYAELLKGKVDDRVIQALLKYEVSIDD